MSTTWKMYLFPTYQSPASHSEQAEYPHWDSNPDLTDFKSAASAKLGYGGMVCNQISLSCGRTGVR